jgi:hypothetical protein
MPAGIRKGAFLLANPIFALDGMPTPVAAYALHRLSRNYQGHLITVRRSSDNAIQSFGASQPEIDISEIQSWVGSGNSGFVTEWFDQSGNNRNITQPITTAQPTVLESGTIVELFAGGKPTINFNLNKGLWGSVAQYDCQMVFAACRSISATFAQFHAPFNNGRQGALERVLAFRGGDTGFHSSPTPISARRNGNAIGTDATGVLNPIMSPFLVTAVTASNNSRSVIEVGNWIDNGRGACLQSCAIAFPSPLPDSNRNTLETRLMNYYGIT